MLHMVWSILYGGSYISWLHELIRLKTGGWPNPAFEHSDFQTTAERRSIGNDRANIKIIKRKNLVVYDDLT